jgi:hypothetical protein
LNGSRGTGAVTPKSRASAANIAASISHRSTASRPSRAIAARSFDLNCSSTPVAL